MKKASIMITFFNIKKILLVKIFKFDLIKEVITFNLKTIE